jgi:hypothetical protein
VGVEDDRNFGHQIGIRLRSSNLDLADTEAVTTHAQVLCCLLACSWPQCHQRPCAVDAEQSTRAPTFAHLPNRLCDVSSCWHVPHSCSPSQHRAGKVSNCGGHASSC